jgi:hypothetical protein
MRKYYSSRTTKKSKVFVRVYNNEGQKIAKGKILNITDDALILKKGSSSITIPTADIMYIKTKKTNGHNVLIGGVAGAGFVLGLGLAGDGLDAFAAVIIIPVFAVIGSGIGYITSLFKNSQHYSIQGDPTKWQGFKEVMYAPN